MSSPEAPPAIASVASPAASSLASGVEAAAREPLNRHLFSDAELAAAAETEEILRKQLMYITPSNVPIWRGQRLAGQRFTYPQINRMRGMRGRGIDIDPMTVDRILVRSAVTIGEIPRLPSAPPRFLIFSCPILARRGAEKLKVISAGGSVQWVYFDGSISKGRG